MTVSQKVTRHVIPAEAGIYGDRRIMDTRLRGDDANGPNSNFYEAFKNGFLYG